ncbi:DUF927 domain-containing protein [uncultured Thiohalocapsa sp.]|uniref:DUF927 domain-containing protein n=1 Tax=uncultured Thiohalocapsa sp. TaxID=768990 RepID=UPI0025EE369A|nr:DUF927 domain-containing protein [uncultured Thiohalocapsa sp.]
MPEQTPAPLPKGYDAADALAAGWTAATFAAAARWRPIEAPAPAKPTKAPAPPAGDADGLPFPFEARPGGIYYAKPGAKRRSGDDAPPVWICSPLRVIALTRDARGDDFGRLVEFEDPDGNPRRLAIPAADLQGSGEALRARLARLGLEVSTHPEARRAFLELLQRWRPEARARSTTRTGWTDGGAFVLPDRVIGDEAEPVILAGELAEPPAFAVRGTVEDWRRHVGLPCIGNSRLLFCVSVAFAAPLLHLIGGESGGFHLKGSSTDASSSGKTTCQRVAASVCGAPDYLQRWRTTDNALEATAELSNDAPLILDEFGQMDPKAAGEAGYMLANGSGKARAARTGDARPVKHWRVLFLSSGEIGLAEHMASANKRARAGQEVRMAEIPADAGAGYGCFEDLHGEPDGAAFAVRLTEAAATYYGAPFIAWIEAVQAQRARLPARVKELRDLFVSDALSGIKSPPGQVRRVAARFGLVGVAGELATHAGLTGWAEDAAYEAALRCFGDWLKARGGPIPAEERDLLSQVRHWFEQHSNRLRWKDRALDDHAPEVPRQAGFKHDPGDEAGGLVYYVFGETFKRELCEGHDYRDAARVLVRRGLLRPGDDGRPTQKVRLPGFANPQRVYVFGSDLGGGGDDGL